jgi:hypothetical protein
MTDLGRITFSNRLDLDRFFFAVKDEIYTIVKLGDFPNYYRGSDIDIFCYDKGAFGRKILAVGNQYLNQGFEIKVTNRGEIQTYVDFYFDGELEFRFDLYQSLPDYQRIHLKKFYIYSVIENAQALDRIFDGKRYSIYVPAVADELLLRYVEYLEWYEVRPDKIKHLEYIVDAASEDPSRITFLDKLHLYTELPSPRLERSLLSRFYAFRWIAFWVKRVQSVSWRRSPWILLTKLRQRMGM